VNADDFGQSLGINRGIIKTYERGVVTGASLMVRWPAAEEAGSYPRSHPDLGVGLHVDLRELAYHDGRWQQPYEVDGDRAVEISRPEGVGFEHLLGILRALPAGVTELG